MDEYESKILEETKRFFNALPELIETVGGRWVVFRDGVVVSDYATEDEAYRSAITLFGEEGGYVIGQVVAVEPTPVTAGVMFGFAP